MGNSVQNENPRPPMPLISFFSRVECSGFSKPVTVLQIPLLGGLLLVLGVMLATGGCGKKITKTGVPFELDAVFQGKLPALKTSPKERGIRLAKERNFQEAIEAFTQHVLEEPENFSGFNALAVCYKNMGDHANAMKNFERALEFAESTEEQAKILANIGNLYYVANKPQVALGYYKEATTLFDKNPLYLILIARTFVALQEYDRARRVLATAEEISKDLEKYERDDERGLGSYLMAYCYVALNDEEKVYLHVENALKANPGRYVTRFKEDVDDSTSPLYTLKGDPRFEKIIKTYSAKSHAG
jgi:tetratricopeptide (TPR) repeat protein